MSRTNRSKTTREAPTGRLASPGIDQATRFIDVRGHSNAANTAQALSQAFSVAGDAYVAHTINKERDGFKDAHVDKAAGALSEEKREKNRGYSRAWAQLEANDDSLLAERRLEEALLKVDFAALDEEELQALIDDQLKPMFDGADSDPDYLQALAPRLLALEENIFMRHRDLTLQAMQEAGGARITRTLSDDFEKTGVFDYDYLAKMTAVVYDGEEKVNAYANQLFGIAIDLGRPDLIRDMPSKFPGGVADTIKDRHDWKERIRNAEIRAEAVAQGKRDGALKADAAALKAQQEAAEREIYLMTARGQNPTAHVNSYVAGGVLTVEQARAAERWDQGQQEKKAGGYQMNPAVVAQMRWDFTVDPNSVSNAAIKDHFLAGAFGHPRTEDAIGMFEKMLNDRETALRALPTNPIARARREELASTTGPTGAARALGRWDPSIARQQARALSTYDLAVANGEEPDAAYESAMSAFEQEGGIRPQDNDNPTPQNTAALLSSGQASPARFLRQMQEQGWSRTDAMHALEAANVPDETIDAILFGD